jgi:hypothetical protein
MPSDSIWPTIRPGENHPIRSRQGGRQGDRDEVGVREVVRRCRVRVRHSAIALDRTRRMKFDVARGLGAPSRANRASAATAGRGAGPSAEAGRATRCADVSLASVAGVELLQTLLLVGERDAT